MNRAQRRVIRDALNYGRPQVSIPFTAAFWLLYVLCVAALVKYLA